MTQATAFKSLEHDASLLHPCWRYGVEHGRMRRKVEAMVNAAGQSPPGPVARRSAMVKNR